MHEPDTILLSSLRLIITKIRAKYLSKRVYGCREKLNGQTDRQTDRQTDEEKYYIDCIGGDMIIGDRILICTIIDVVVPTSAILMASQNKLFNTIRG